MSTLNIWLDKMWAFMIMEKLSHQAEVGRGQCKPSYFIVAWASFLNAVDLGINQVNDLVQHCRSHRRGYEKHRLIFVFFLCIKLGGNIEKVLFFIFKCFIGHLLLIRANLGISSLPIRQGNGVNGLYQQGRGSSQNTLIKVELQYLPRGLQLAGYKLCYSADV